MRVSFDQSLVVFESLSLLCTLYAASAVGDGAPETDVAVVGAGKDVFVVGGEFGGEDSVGGGVIG